MSQGTLYGVGLGPGDPELLTLKAARILREVPLIAYPAPPDGASLARAIAAPHLPGGQEEIVIRMPLDAARFPAPDVYSEAAHTLTGWLAEGRDAAVLCEGDPFFYGSFLYLFERLASANRVVVVPGVSSPMACASTLAIPLAARNDVLTILPAPLNEATLKERLAACDAACVIKVGRHLDKVRSVLREAGLLDRARYVERATMAAERVLPLAAVAAPAPYFSMILVHRRGVAWR